MVDSGVKLQITLVGNYGSGAEHYAKMIMEEILPGSDPVRLVNGETIFFTKQIILSDGTKIGPDNANFTVVVQPSVAS